MDVVKAGWVGLMEEHHVFCRFVFHFQYPVNN